MIRIRRSEQRGHADHGWLDARHTFSFADYYDPEFTRFETLRVFNQDRIQPIQGFATHGHADMEIVTYVLEGVLQHRDSMGSGSKVHAGEVQFMSAGTGVTHSEFNASADEELHLLQMWILPRERGTEPHYDQRASTPAGRRGKLQLVVSPQGEDDSIRIGQNAWLWIGSFDAGERTDFTLRDGHSAWLHVASGRLMLGEEELGPGDGVAIREEPGFCLQGVEQAEVVLWDLANI
jgi:redox-sensitive bicupin YhaK (pirin superfamily)